MQTHQNSVQELSHSGDQFERLICQHNDDLHQILAPYSQIWIEHIYPRRIGDGSSLEEGWMSFGGSHYTALIRLHHADESRKEVIKLCNELQSTATRGVHADNFAKLLRLHAASAAMWENLGAAIDNFRLARFEAAKLVKHKQPETIKRCPKCDKPLDQEYKTTGTPLSEVANPKLYFAYQRRTQFIHSRIVPIQITEGIVEFNLIHFQDERTQWPPTAVKLKQLDHVVLAEWESIIMEFASEWWELHSLLAGKLPPLKKDASTQHTNTPTLSTPDRRPDASWITHSTSGIHSLDIQIGDTP